MKRNLRLIHCIPFAMFVTGMFFHSCKDDVFNAEKVKATYQNKFPVKDIDPNMDWKMTRQVAVDISVHEDYGVNYTVEIFDHNPFATDTIIHLLAKGTANQDLPFTTTIDCPSIISTLYVTRVDPAGRRTMKPVYISNDKLITSFGSKPITTRAASPQSKEVTLQTMTRPYTDREIADMLSKATEYTGQDMDVNLTQHTLYKITGQYKGGINHAGTLTPNAGMIKLIVAPGAEWKIPSLQTINQGLEIIVASQGKIELKAGSQQKPSLKFTNTSSLVVLGTAYQEDEDDDEEDLRGKISGNGWIEFSNGGIHYNAGDIDIDGINNNGGTFFNYGETDVEELIGSSTGSLYVNHGDLEADKIGADESTGPKLENSCKIKVETHLSSTGIKMGTGAQIKCKHLYAYGYIDLSENSMIKVENNTKFYNCNITGPTADKSYALLKLKTISEASWKGTYGIECTAGYLINNIYCEYKAENSSWDFTNCYLNGKAGGNGRKGNGNAVLCREGEAPAYIPAGRCTGEGNTPDEGGEDIPAPPITHTYVFEDNFPLVGDYDFNDVVLDAQLFYDREGDDETDVNNKIKKVKIYVTLAAVGASKELGAGLRIIGLHEADIKELKCKGNADRQYFSTLSGSFFANGYNNISDGHRYTDSNEGIVIPLFGDAHKAILGQSALTSRLFVNTLTEGISHTDLKTYEIEIELHKDRQTTTPYVTLDNLDFFIGYRYKNMEQRMEVHLYEFWQLTATGHPKYGPTPGGTMQTANLDLAGNNTWAICVPNFSYPKEYINISDRENKDDCAYPLFIGWACDRNTNQDWYMRPNKKNIYR